MISATKNGIYAKIEASGSFLPTTVVTNDQLAKVVDTSDEWITERTGIKCRHLAGPKDTTLSMAVAAAKDCLAHTDRPSEEVLASIDLVLVATCTADYLFPSVACGVQQALGLNAREVPSLDLSAACAGFVYALDVAEQYILSKRARSVLVIGVDRMSSIVDWSDRSTCILFADGAAAVLLSASKDPGILGTCLHSDGVHSDMLYATRENGGKIKMRGNATFKLAVTKLSEVVEELLSATKLTRDQVDWLVPHQANIRIIEATAKRLNLSEDRVIQTVKQHGNTSAASVPLALDYGIRNGLIKRGELLLLDAFGGGMTWGASLIKY